jgi:uncharacterized Tic20 family protein
MAPLAVASEAGPVAAVVPAQAVFQATSAPDLERQARQMAVLLHLSQFAGYIVFLGGMIVPILIWQLNKDKLPGIDAHGKNVVNWIISVFIYGVGCLVLLFVLIAGAGGLQALFSIGLFSLIAIPLGIILGLLSIISPIVAAIKANNGEIWQYPMAIRFLK